MQRYDRYIKRAMSKDSGTTKKYSKDLRIKFEVKQFRKRIFDERCVLQSEPVRVDNVSGKATWMIIVAARSSPDGCSSNDTCHIKLRLINMRPTYIKCFPVIYSIGVLNVDGVVDCKTENLKASSSDLVTLFGNGVDIFTRSKLLANKSRFIIDDAVTFVCQIDIGDVDDTKEAPNFVPYIERIYADGILTDTVLVTEDGKTLNAHRCILARSPVFHVMFQNDMLEKNSGEVHVNIISHEVLKEMVLFMYSDRVNDIDIIAGDLMLAADYYDLPDLKTMCLKSLEAHVNFKNFAQSLYIAERFEIDTLREAVLRFVVGNRKSIASTTGWEEVKENRELYDVVTEALLNTN